MFFMKKVEQFALRLETLNVKFEPICWIISIEIAVLCEILENWVCHGNIIIVTMCRLLWFLSLTIKKKERKALKFNLRRN